MKNKNEKNGRRSLAVRVISLIVVFALVLGAVWLVENYDTLSLGAISRSFKRLFGQRGGAQELRFDVYPYSVFAAVDGCVAAVSEAGIQLIGDDGELLETQSQLLTRPCVDGGGSLAAAWSSGSTGYWLMDGKGLISEVHTDGGVISICVSRDGRYAVAAEEAGYKGAVTVYNTKREAVYKWYSGENYLIGSALSGSSDRMSALTLSGSQSRVVCFSLDRPEQRGEWVSEEEVFFDLGFIGSESICSISEERAVFLDENAAETGSYVYAGGRLRDYSLDGTDFAVLAIERYAAGGGTDIVAVNVKGEAAASVSESGQVISVSASGRYISVLCSDGLTVYTKNMEKYAEIDDVTGVVDASVRGDGSVVMFTGSGAVIYTP